MKKLLQDLLDLHSQVSLMQQAYYDTHLAPFLEPAEGNWLRLIINSG